jgi:hypothetical protein
MNDIDQLPLSAFMPGNSVSSPGKPFIANAGKKKMIIVNLKFN